MKILLLLFMVCPFAAFATPSEGDSRAPDTIYYHHGVAKKFPVSGGYSESLVSMIVRKIDDNHKYIIYRKLTNQADRSYVLLIKSQANIDRRCVSDNDAEASCAVKGPTFVKIYVPSGDQSLTNIDEYNVTALKMREAGWGHVHAYFTHHGYWKHSYFFNYAYPGAGRVDANITVKTHPEGKRHVHSKYAISNDKDGLQYVWTDKMKLVFTAP